MITDFLENLANRKRSENDLSDITWALCKSSHTFQTLFLNLFFPDEQFLNITRFEREKAEGDSRPDFLIENNGLIYLVECKINDRNHHFEQYTSTFDIPNSRLGYITNYKMFEVGFNVKTWEELYDLIQINLPENEEEISLWTGYSKYLKSVCSIIKITKSMELKGMYSLYAFSEIVKKLVDRSESEFELKYYSNKNIQGGSGISGCYFEIKYIKTQINTTWAWIGVYYERENPLICLGFENKEGWGKPFYDIIEKNFNSIEKDEFSEKPYYEDGAVWFELTSEKHIAIDNNELNDQIKILKDYMDEVILIPIKMNK